METPSPRHRAALIPNSPFRISNFFPAFVLFLALLAAPAQAAPISWSGVGSGNMTGAVNGWGGGNATAPGTNDIAVWNSTSYTTPPNANGNMTIGELWFGPSNGGVTFGSGAGNITLSANATGSTGIGILMDSGSGAVTFNGTKFLLGATQTWMNNSASLLTVNGTITNSSSSSNYTLTINGTGNTSLRGVISNNSTTGTLALIKNDAGTLTLSGANTFTGGLDIKNGTVVANVSNVSTTSGAAGPSTSAITLGDSAGGSASLLANSFTVSNTITLGTGALGTLTIGNNGSATAAVFSGAISLNSNNLTISSTGTGSTTLSGGITGTGDLTFTNSGSATTTVSTTSVNNTGNITNVGAGSGIVTISSTVGTSVKNIIQSSSTSMLALNANNTGWTGGIQINSGTLETIYNGTNGTGTGTITLGSNATNADAMFLWNVSGGTMTNAITVADGGGNRTIRVSNSGNINLLDNITLNHDLVIDNTSAGNFAMGNGTTAGFNGNYTVTFTNSGGNPSASTTLSGNHTNFTGNLVISANATLIAGNTGANLTLTNGTVNVLGGNFDVNQNTSIGGLNGNSTANTYASTAKTLTLTGNSTYTYAGTVRNGLNALALTMSGTGTQILSGNNTYTGATTVNSGTLRAGSSTAFGINSAVVVGTGATLDLAGFNNSIGSLANSGNGGYVTLGTGTLTTGGANTSTSYNGTISGTGGSLIKVGTGNQTLGGNNTYNGGTTISGGTLIVNRTTGSLASGTALTINGLGGTFTLDNVGASGALSQSLGALTFSAGDGTVKTNRTAAQNTAITFSSLAARPAGTAGTFVIAGTAGTANGIVFTGRAAGFMDKGIFYGTGTGTASSYAWYDSTGFVRGINYGGDPGTATSGANATLASTTNQQITGAISAQNTATFTTLQISGSTSLTLNPGATVTVDGILKMGNAAGDATISGGTGIMASLDAEMVVRSDMSNDGLTINSDILANGSNAFTKSGLGSLTLTGNNTYTGTTTVLGGLLSLGNGNATGTLATTGAIALNGGSLVINHSNPTAQGTDFSSAAITGSGSLTQLGGGGLTLNAANTYTGNTTVGAASGANVGTLSLTGSGKIGTGAVTVYGGTLDLTNTTQTITTLDLGSGASGSTANVTIGSGGVLNLGGAVSYNTTNNPNGATISGSGALNLNGSRTFTVGNSTAAAADLTVSAVIADGSAVSGLTKSGNGTLVLSGMNTYTGLTSISSGGILSVSYIGNGNATSNVGASTSAGTNLSIQGGTLQYMGANVTTDRLIQIGANMISTLEASGTGAISFVNAGSISLSGSSATHGLVLTGTNTGNNILTPYLSDQTGSTLSTLTKTGVGTWVLAGNNTYTGNTTISAGILQFAKQTSLYTGNNTRWTAAKIIVANGGTLALNVGGSGEFTTANVTTILASLGGANGTSTTGFAGGSNIAFDTTNAGATFTVSDVIANSSGTGGGAVGVTKLGTNTLVLTGGNTYNGTTTIVAGTLQLGNGNGTGSLSTSSAIVNNANLTVNRNTPVSQGVDFSAAAITGNGSFTQAGSGNTTLNVANSYTGNTTVTAGTLLVSNASGSGSGLGTGNAIVNGGTLGGSGSFTGTVTVNSGGTLAPGSSIESLGSGSITFTGGAFAYELSTSTPNADLLFASGNTVALTLSGTPTMTIADLGSKAVLGLNTKFTLISYTAAGGWNGGTFNGYANGYIFTLDNNQWQINYADTTPGSNFNMDATLFGDQFVTITVVPEPQTWALLAFSLTTVVVLRRRRR